MIRFAFLCLIALSAHAETLTGSVVSVADGDTITVLDASKVQHKIRLSGIDAPEKTQPFGDRSKQNLARMVFNNNVSVEWNKRDRYGRIVGKVMVQPADCPTCPMTLDAGHAQIFAGLARGRHRQQYRPGSIIAAGHRSNARSVPPDRHHARSPDRAERTWTDDLYANDGTEYRPPKTMLH